MTINPHPAVLAGLSAQRRADLLSQFDGERLARLAQGHGNHRRSWANTSTARMLAVQLALQLAAVRHGLHTP